jgi:predicted HTH domain antitoxin
MVDDLDSLSIAQRYILGLLLNSTSNRIPDHLVLQKEMFLLSEASEPLAEKCSFAPHFKGPYSEEVEGSLADLQDLGLVKVDSFKQNIRLDPAAKQRVAEWWNKVPLPVASSVVSVTSFMHDLTNDEVLLGVYHDRPDMAVQSVVRDQVTARRIPNAVSLYRKGKVSLSRGAELAGLSQHEFRKILHDKGLLRVGHDDLEASKRAAAKLMRS